MGFFCFGGRKPDPMETPAALKPRPTHRIANLPPPRVHSVRNPVPSTSCSGGAGAGGSSSNAERYANVPVPPRPSTPLDPDPPRISTSSRPATPRRRNRWLRGKASSRAPPNLDGLAIELELTPHCSACKQPIWKGRKAAVVVPCFHWTCQPCLDHALFPGRRSQSLARSAVRGLTGRAANRNREKARAANAASPPPLTLTATNNTNPDAAESTGREGATSRNSTRRDEREFFLGLNARKDEIKGAFRPPPQGGSRSHAPRCLTCRRDFDCYYTVASHRLDVAIARIREVHAQAQADREWSESGEKVSTLMRNRQQRLQKLQLLEQQKRAPPPARDSSSSEEDGEYDEDPLEGSSRDWALEREDGEEDSEEVAVERAGTRTPSSGNVSASWRAPPQKKSAKARGKERARRSKGGFDFGFEADAGEDGDDGEVERADSQLTIRLVENSDDEAELSPDEEDARPDAQVNGGKGKGKERAEETDWSADTGTIAEDLADDKPADPDSISQRRKRFVLESRWGASRKAERFTSSRRRVTK